MTYSTITKKIGLIAIIGMTLPMLGQDRCFLFNCKITKISAGVYNITGTVTKTRTHKRTVQVNNISNPSSIEFIQSCCGNSRWQTFGEMESYIPSVEQTLSLFTITYSNFKCIMLPAENPDNEYSRRHSEGRLDPRIFLTVDQGHPAAMTLTE